MPHIGTNFWGYYLLPSITGREGVPTASRCLLAGGGGYPTATCSLLAGGGRTYCCCPFHKGGWPLAAASTLHKRHIGGSQAAAAILLIGEGGDHLQPQSLCKKVGP